ncbi:MAG: tRNA uridine-5-carboxymethylaminomethyl(34) synthesis GTPase MnmE [Gammaproteobacteria bacterium]|nr:tRNA uridine-5-carboxymethylaminomethyl(34) synthesis GTPase MnmE [Gammaproteobacteria bacterium]
MHSLCNGDDIVAIATPPGRGGVSIARLSGPNIPTFAQHFLGSIPTPRLAKLTEFKAGDGSIIDHGLALFFPFPNSYTGEHVLELHAHGSPIVMQMLVKRCLEYGMRLARPGEFSERAFLNGRLDLAQAEAVADLIASNTESAAKSAFNSLKGEFSERIHQLVGEVTELRIYVEAAIDFPDEEIDFLADGEVLTRLHHLRATFRELKKTARQGRLLRDGLKVVLTGLPNVGKSSLMNNLTNENRAIVSAIPGTTRDVLEQTVQIDGLPIELIDTAGVRNSADEIELEGVKRALEAQRNADLILLVVDDAREDYGHHGKLEGIDELFSGLPLSIPVIVVRNKIDLNDKPAGRLGDDVCVSALTGLGMDVLKEVILEKAGYRQIEDSQFIARERHMDAIRRGEEMLLRGITQLTEHQAGELLAEDLLECQRALGEITGEVTSEDLLGLIFGSFCIGK